MITITNTEVFGWEAAIRGMRNPMNSWDKSDSGYEWDSGIYHIGKNDLKLMRTLANAGSDHGKFLRMITVTMDVNAPLYWWKEADTYKVGTVANSCSTMHKIHAKEFTLDDFSHERLFNADSSNCFEWYFTVLETVISSLNAARHCFLETKSKLAWWQMIQLLPSSYNQLRTVQLNYQVLKNMYHSRKNHKLDEWHDFCDWIRSLPHSELITGESDNV